MVAPDWQTRTKENIQERKIQCCIWQAGHGSARALAQSVISPSSLKPSAWMWFPGKPHSSRGEPKPEHCHARLAGVLPAIRWGPGPIKNPRHLPGCLAGHARQCLGSGAISVAAKQGWGWGA